MFVSRNVFSDMEMDRESRQHSADQRGLLHTILNDDEVNLYIDDLLRLEGNNSNLFTLSARLAGTPSAGFTVGFSTTAGTATSGVDYMPTTGTLTFAGTTDEIQVLSIPINGDTTLEADENFFVEEIWPISFDERNDTSTITRSSLGASASFA